MARTETERSAPPLTTRRIFATWWPLAASWLLMAIELPLVSAVVARLADPAVNLAAYGGVVFPVALIIESPVIMLLAASTALSRDWASYALLRRYMNGAGLLLTALHLAIAFTPLFDLLVAHVLHAPPITWEAARVGLQIMTPWTWSIAYRRFHQGVLIAHGRSRAVGLGTVVRLTANAAVLFTGYALDGRGIAVGTAAIAAGVVSEAIYIGLRVRPVLRERLRPAPPADPPLTRAAFARFYVPLALTSLLNLLMEPIGAAALGRMPRPLESLAVWPVLVGLVFMSESAGLAFNEVVVALLGQPGSRRALGRFAAVLVTVSGGALLLLTATPLSLLWMERVAGLPPDLARFASRGLWLALPWPILAVVNNFYQGALVHGGRTRAIPVSVGLFLLTASAVAGAGVVAAAVAGLYVALAALALGLTVQALWLRRAGRERLDELEPGASAGRPR